MTRNRILTGALLSYLLGYLYVEWIMIGTMPLRYILFAIAFAAFAEYHARIIRQPHTRLSLFWLGFVLIDCILMECLLSFPDQFYEIRFLQTCSIHLAAVYYVLVRFDLLSQHRTGNLILLDLLSGFILIPFRNLFLRIRTVLSAGILQKARSQWMTAFWTVLIAVPVTMFAWSQLADVSQAFASVHLDLSLFSEETVIKFILSIPIGAWLYGLTAGCAERTSPYFEELRVHDSVDACRIIPLFTEDTVIGILILLYTVFFITEIRTLMTADIHLVTQASVFAIQGFWSLCRIMVLNLTVLGACTCFSPKDSLYEGRRRTEAAVLMGYGLAFCVLNAVKLLHYMSYGITERRLIAFWVLVCLFCACLTALLHLFRRVQAVRIITVTAAAAFLVLSASVSILHPLESYEEAVTDLHREITRI